MHLTLTSYFLPCIWSRRPEGDKLESLTDTMLFSFPLKAQLLQISHQKRLQQSGMWRKRSCKLRADAPRCIKRCEKCTGGGSSRGKHLVPKGANVLRGRMGINSAGRQFLNLDRRMESVEGCWWTGGKYWEPSEVKRNPKIKGKEEVWEKAEEVSKC